MSKTTIIQYSASGRQTFKAEMPGKMSRRAIKKECRKWRVPTTNLTVIYHEIIKL